MSVEPINEATRRLIQGDREMWLEIARHLTAISAAIKRRYTDGQEPRETRPTVLR